MGAGRKKNSKKIILGSWKKRKSKHRKFKEEQKIKRKEKCRQVIDNEINI